MSDANAPLPAWIKRRDGSQVPFEADRICQALFAAAEALGTASPFFIRELTDAVLHFLAREPGDPIPSTAEIADEIEKIVRELGHPHLAQCFAENQRRTNNTQPQSELVACSQTPAEYLGACLEAFVLETVFTRDVAAAVREGLVRIGGMESPGKLTSLVLETPRFADLPWWLALDDWRAAGGGRWIVDSPEWLCTPNMQPGWTPQLCERLLALPTLSERQIELHLNIAEAPAWSRDHLAGPLFTSDDADASRRERINFLDGFLERWRVLTVPRVPAIAWHLHEHSFHQEAQRRQLQALLRQALQGKRVRFVFDRGPVKLAEGLDRKCPGVLLEIGLDLPLLARRADTGTDGQAFLKKLQSLAHIAVSAAQQNYRFVRDLEPAPLQRTFLLERAASVLTPLGLDDVVQQITGASLTQSPLSLAFALQILTTMNDALKLAGRTTNLDLRLDGSLRWPTAADNDVPPRRQLEIAGKLHGCAGAGTATLALPDDQDADLDGLTELLRWTWASTTVTRLHLQRGGSTLQQGELPI